MMRWLGAPCLGKTPGSMTAHSRGKWWGWGPTAACELSASLPVVTTVVPISQSSQLQDLLKPSMPQNVVTYTCNS
jgi:hypothetical protein